MDTRISAVWKPLVVLAATLIVLAGMKIGAFFLAPLLMALFFAAVLAPFRDGLLARKAPRGLAVFATIVVYILIFVFLAWVLSTAVTEIGDILRDMGAQITANAQAGAEQVGALPVAGPALRSAADSLDPSQLGNVAAGLASAAANLLSTLLLSSFLFVFLVIELPTIMRRLREIFGAGHPIPVRAEAAADNTARFFILRTLVNLVTGVGIFVVCLLMNIPNALLWGLMVFVLSYVPYIGMFIACIPPSLLALAGGGLSYMLLFITIITVVNMLAEQVVSPLITGKGLRMSATLVFLSFMFWGNIFGGAGFFLAVPLTVGLLLFFGAFEETKGLVAAVSDIPLPEPPAEPVPSD